MRLETLRSNMRDELQPILSQSQEKGHRKLCKWMILTDETSASVVSETTTSPSKVNLILDEAEPTVKNSEATATRQPGMILDDQQAVA
jgi:hypothetical protein